MFIPEKQRGLSLDEEEQGNIKRMSNDECRLCGDHANVSNRIDHIAQTLQNTEHGWPLIEFGKMMSVDIILSDEMDTAGYFSQSLMGGPEIYLNATLPDETLIMALAHELRHVEQMINLQATLHDFSLKDAVKLNRILEADASAYSAAVSFELYKKTGNKGFLAASEDYSEDDIRDAFNNAADHSSPHQRHNPAPFQAAFAQ